MIKINFFFVLLISLLSACSNEFILEYEGTYVGTETITSETAPNMVTPVRFFIEQIPETDSIIWGTRKYGMSQNGFFGPTDGQLRIQQDTFEFLWKLAGNSNHSDGRILAVKE